MSDPGVEGSLDVTDLYDAFHEVAQLVWRRFGFERAAGQEHPMLEPAFDEIVDQLEVDLFLPACARYAFHERGVLIDPEDVPGLLFLKRRGTVELVGAAARYHSHAFHPSAGAPRVPNEVLAGNLMPVPREEIALLLVPDASGEDGGGKRRPDLRVI